MNGKKLSQFAPQNLDRRLMKSAIQEMSYRGGGVAAWQSKLRKKLRSLLGLDLLAERPPLRVRSLWKRSGPLGTIERIVFTSEPGSDVPAYACVPANARPPYTWMICLQGHSTGMHNSIGVVFGDETRQLAAENDRDFGLQCMQRGLAALCIEQRGFGERSGAPPNVGCHEPTMNALILGRTMIGNRVFDVDRAIDYLETRDDVDAGSLGVMGNSGGGTTTMFAAALLPRIRFAMPSCYFCTFEHSIMSIRHCLCNYVPGLFRVAEMADIMGLFAPRPVVVVAGEKDNIFPIKAVRSSFRRLRGIYRAAGAESHCRLVVGPEGHRFYADLSWPFAMKELRALRP